MKYLLLGLLLLPQGKPAPPKVTEATFTVVFSMKQLNMFEPVCRIYVSIQGKTEGEAAIRAYTYLQQKLSIPSAEQLEFSEAQKKDDGK